ncbi:hypothetical protein BJ546DRAFT_123328 [Cryomyces antarcticus]
MEPVCLRSFSDTVPDKQLLGIVGYEHYLRLGSECLQDHEDHKMSMTVGKLERRLVHLAIRAHRTSLRYGTELKALCGRSKLFGWTTQVTARVVDNRLLMRVRWFRSVYRGSKFSRERSIAGVKRGYPSSCPHKCWGGCIKPSEACLEAVTTMPRNPLEAEQQRYLCLSRACQWCPSEVLVELKPASELSKPAIRETSSSKAGDSMVCVSQCVDLGEGISAESADWEALTEGDKFVQGKSRAVFWNATGTIRERYEGSLSQ